MTTISFLTPFQYGHKDLTLFERSQNLIESYFSWGRVLVIQPDRMTAVNELYAPSYREIAFKVVSFITGVFPLIVLALKSIARALHTPVVYLKSSAGITPVSKALFPEKNEALTRKVDLLFQKKQNHIFWMPHPKFEKGDETSFPEDKVTFFQVNDKVKTQVACFGREKLMKYMQRQISGEVLGGNTFFKWLNGKVKNLDLDRIFEEKKSLFMNCSDFVYLALYQAGLVSKEVIASAYKKTIEDELSGKKVDNFYGFDLKQFKEWDEKNSKAGPKPGDILIGFEEDVPVHILFASGRDQHTGNIKGKGLWNLIGLPKLSEETVSNMKNAYGAGHKKALIFKYCPLEAALESLPKKS